LSSRPPMPSSERNKKLFLSVQETASSIGLSVSEEFRSGVSDANLIAEKQTPVIDGLGPIGAMDHSADEYMIKASLLQRSILVACALIDCWEKYQRGILF
jgi:glutamate carboxypeptidase